MFPTWRLRLREARTAYQSGRYEEAVKLLLAESLREFLPAKQLAQNVAGKLVVRAGDRFARGDSTAGWRDLSAADRLGGQEEPIRDMRRQYAVRGLHEALENLVIGEPDEALARLAKVERHAQLDSASRRCRQVARLMRVAEQAAQRGHFAEASAAIEHARQLTSHDLAESATMVITKRLQEQGLKYGVLAGECQRLSAEMHAALERESWGSALSAAEALLAIAPQHLAAAQTRRRAWKAVGMDVTRHDAGRRPGRPVYLQVKHPAGHVGRRSTHVSARSSEDDTVTGSENPRRALLWVDAVGGYLVCLDDCVVLGQPSGSDTIAVPILADLSRRHAAIRRDGGAYVLEPIHNVSVDGRPITTAIVLGNNHLIQLGNNVRLRFTKPHVLSATAKLVFESHHKTQPSADAVLLMADSCVLGPNRHCHVRCPDWQHDVVVYRQNDAVYCRSDRPLTIDGMVASGASEIQSGQRVEGEEFSFTWETVA
ncbi:MAG: FHA domain-containing protein [Pirellulales bacterium]